MKRLIPIFVLVRAFLAAYTYYYTDALTSINTSNWWQNGTVTATAGGLYSSDANGGSLISKVAVPDGTSDYEVKATLTLAGSGGSYTVYHRASSDALITPGSGSFYAVELQNPTFNGSACTGTLVYYKRIGGVLTTMGYVGVGCHSGMTIRLVVRGSTGGAGMVYLDDAYMYWFPPEAALATGKPGVGGRQMPSGNSIAQVNLGPLDRIAPQAINPQSIGTSVFPNSVEMQWQGVVDDAAGIGVMGISVHKNGAYLRDTREGAFTDASLAPSTPYSYTLYVMDYHMNVSPVSITVTTPVADAVDPRRVGVRPTGTYWGAMGEQIDTLSGNVNFTMPLLKAQGRGGWGVSFSLNYNSQNWRKDGGGTWKLGRDVGYGFGWRLMAGSLMPIWYNYWTVDHWLFTDATGAEYRLYLDPVDGLWKSKESIYVAYEWNSARLYFSDGSFWAFGSVSAGTEEDAGTRYPTLMQDTNGNQVLVRYNNGAGVTWTNSSARINEIEDVRGNNSYVPPWTYRFSYSTASPGDPIPHLTSISNAIGTGETYSLNYSGSFTLLSPFSDHLPFGTTQQLGSLTAGPNLTYLFGYPIPYGGELTHVTFPYGGYLEWTYRDFTYTSATTPRTLREVSERRLSYSGGTPKYYYLYHDDAGDAAKTVHAYTELVDYTAGADKVWYFNWGAGWNIGLISALHERSWPTFTTKRQQSITWVRDSAFNPYVSSAVTTVDPGTAYQKQKKTDQTLDQWGNVTHSNIYDWGNPTPGPLARAHIHTYLSNSNYTSRFIRNRLVSTTVSGVTTPLVTNTYDGTALTNRTGLREHDSTNYGTGFLYRGNVTRTETPSSKINIAYDITGSSTTTDDGYGLSVSATPAANTNNAAPGVIMPNSNSNLQTSLAYTAWLGVTTVTKPNNSIAETHYDSYGRVDWTRSQHGATTNYAYDYAAKTVTATTNNRWVKTTMDGLGRPVKMERGYGTNTVSIVDTVYDSCACSPVGKVKDVSQPYVSGGTVYWTTTTYDVLGRPLTVNHPDGSGTTAYLYEGNATTVTDPAGKWKKAITDAMGNLTQVIEPNPAGGTFTTDYSYDSLNRLTAVSMPRPAIGGGTVTQQRTFTYDPATQRLSSAFNPESGTVNYYYQSNGFLANKVDAKDQKVAYSYDGFGRVSQINRHPVSTGAADVCQSVSLYYDELSLYGPHQYNWGRLTTAAWGNPDPAVCPAGKLLEKYDYTVGGLVNTKRIVVQRKIDTEPFRSGYIEWTALYDTNGDPRLGTEQYPNSGAVFNYGADGMARPLTVYGPFSTQFYKDAVYGPGDELTSLSVLNSGTSYWTEARTYNKRFQMTKQTVAGVMDLEYTYPAPNAGQISKSKNSWPGQSVEEVDYQYDLLGRLTKAETIATGPQWGYQYTFDGFGNRESQQVTPGKPGTSSYLTYDRATNRITTAGFSYDANGNLTVVPGVGTITYDVENRVTSAGGDTYAYDLSNRRIKKNNFVHFYAPDGRFLGIYIINYTSPTISFTTVQTHLYFGGKLIRSIDGATVNSTTGEPVLSDRLGSVRARATRRIDYFPYGEVRSETPSTVNDRQKFGTYYRDSATGFDYADQRYFSSQTARFLTPDRYRRSARRGNPNSWNRYTYVIGDPVNFNDPRGLCATMLAGITMSPGSGAFDNLAIQLGATSGFPYNDLSPVSSVASVLSQALLGPNDSTAAAYWSLQNALRRNSGLVDVIAYSGGAQAFATALGMLSGEDRTRIGTVLYISPGMSGTLPVTNNPGNTTVIWGEGSADVAATFGTIIPLTVQPIRTSCHHTDLTCLFRAAAAQLSKISAGGRCVYQDIYLRGADGLFPRGGDSGGGRKPGENGGGGMIVEESEEDSETEEG
jgi:RHS repeat-associated protein